MSIARWLQELLPDRRLFPFNMRMKVKIPSIARILLGLIYFVFGLNGLFNFLPMTPPPMPEAATSFMTGMMATGYFLPFLKITESVCGLLLLTGWAASLALVVIAPVTLNIILFHGLLTPGIENLILPLVMVALQVVAMSAYWNRYRPLFQR